MTEMGKDRNVFDGQLVGDMAEGDVVFPQLSYVECLHLVERLIAHIPDEDWVYENRRDDQDRIDDFDEGS